MNYPCDQTDCIIHPIYVKTEKERIKQESIQIQPINNNRIKYTDINTDIDINTIYLANTTWESIGQKHTYINVPCLNESITFECLLCQHFKHQDMKSNLIVYNAKNILNE